MALIECGECGAKISDKAPTCPKCGNPQDASTSKPEPVQTPQPPHDDRKKKIKMAAIGIAAVGLLFLILLPSGILLPQGVIVEKSGDDLASKIGNYAYRVVTKIKNVGASGDITVTAKVYQGEHHQWEKQQTKYVEKGNIETFEIVFTEPTMFGGSAKYSVSCSPCR